MTLRVPPLLQQNAYLGPVPGAELRPPGGGIRDTHLALIRYEGGTRRAYIKHFPDHEPFGLFNEALACTILTGLGVPCAAGAVIYAPVMGAGPVRPAFASLESPLKFEGTAKQIYKVHAAGMAELTRRLHACGAFASIVAADQLLANSDRNLGNIAFVGPHTLEIFDHDAILGGPSLPTERLYEPLGWSRSKLIEDLNPIHTLPKRVKTSIMAAAEVLLERFYQIQPDFREAIQVKANGRSCASADAIWWRSLDLVEWFRQRLGLLI